jgi:type IV secretory pathway VirB2 component (pilin)
MCVCVSICMYMVFKHGQHLWVLKIIISIITTFGNVDMNIYLQSLNLDDT